MSRILIAGATVLPMDPPEAILDPGWVRVENSRIVAVSDQPLVPLNGEDVVHGSGSVVLPGFVNCHTHLAMTLMRGVADDQPLMPWLEETIWPLEAHLTPEDIYWGSLLGIAESLLSGVTCVCDMYFHPEETTRAVEESGIRAVLSGVIMEVLPDPDAQLARAMQFVEANAGRANDRISTVFAPHAPYTVGAERLHRVLDAARRLGAGLHTHLAETRAEVERVRAEHGLTPIAYWESLGAFDDIEPIIAAHCVQLTDGDIAILARADVGVSHNPGANLKLAAGVAPVPRMLAAGVRVGIGTDGPASNNNLDVLEEVRLAALIHKGVSGDPTAIPALQALQMATRDAADVLGLGDRVGRLAPGYQADLILLDTRGLHLTPATNIVSHLVYSARAADVRLVMVAGEIVVRDGALTRVDTNEVCARANAASQRLLAAARTERARAS